MVRKRRKKTKRLSSMSVICISAIAVLNGLGITYGALNDNFQIFNSISTGKIEPYFLGDYELAGKERGEVLDININDNIITINGKVNANYKDNISFYVSNRGTAPIEYKTLQAIDDYEIVNQIAVHEDTNQETKVELHLQANNENNTEENEEENQEEDSIEEIQKDSNYYFRYELIFEQKK